MLNQYMSRHLHTIIKKCLKNDRKAQFDLYHLCFAHLMGICRRYKSNREDAVSLLNDGFLKILLKLETYDRSKEFFPWASAIIIRTAIDDYRKNRIYNEVTDLTDNDEDLEVSLQKGHHQVIGQLSVEEVREMIFELPENERLVFNLFEWEGYQHREIAEKLNVTERTTKRYLKAAKVKLKKMIEKRNDLKKVI